MILYSRRNMSEGFNESRDFSETGNEQQPYTDARGLRGTGPIDFSNIELPPDIAAEVQPIAQNQHSDNDSVKDPEAYMRDLENRRATSQLAENPILPGYLGRTIDHIAENIKGDSGVEASEDELIIEAVQDPAVPNEIKDWLETYGYGLDAINFESVSPTQPSTEEIVEDRLTAAAIKKAVETLDPEERRVIKGLYLEDTKKSVKAVSQETGHSIDAVAAYRKKALAKLRHPSRDLLPEVHPQDSRPPKSDERSPENDIFPSTKNLPVIDPEDDRPYSVRLQEFCQHDEAKKIMPASMAINVQLDSVTSAWSKLELIRTRKVSCLERTQELLQVRRRLESRPTPPSSDSLLVIDTRLGLVKQWLGVLREKEEEIRFGTEE